VPCVGDSAYPPLQGVKPLILLMLLPLLQILQQQLLLLQLTHSPSKASSAAVARGDGAGSACPAGASHTP
jgi:hypothetical protein